MKQSNGIGIQNNLKTIFNMNTMMVLMTVLILLLVLWLWESRIFLVLWYRLIFLNRKNRPFFHDNKSDYFPESEMFENEWRLIKDEMLKYRSIDVPKFHELDSRQSKISSDSGPAWRTILLKAHDAWFKENCEAFPLTYRLLKRCPNVSTAMFSILEPGTVIPPHTGKFKGVLRYHLALQVPKEGRCMLKVGGEEYHWEEGKGVLFDDVFLHEVKNLSQEYRIVLFLDVKRKLPMVLKMPDKLVHFIATFSPRYLKAKRTGTLKMDM